MTSTHPTATDQFPRPHRAPGFLDALASANTEDAGDFPDVSREARRRQRWFDGWMAGRVRKQSRHWRQR